MGMHYLGLLASYHVAQRPGQLRIRKRWCMSSSGFNEKPGCPLHGSADAIDTYTMIDLKGRQPLMPERGDRHIMAAISQRHTQIMNVSLFTTNRGRIELCKHEYAHYKLSNAFGFPVLALASRITRE